MDDLQEDPMIRIKWLICHLRDRYSVLRHNLGLESEPSGVSTFFNGLHVVEQCMFRRDPQLEMFLNILITTAWLRVEEHCRNDFASDNEKTRSMALWRDAFFRASLEMKGIEGTCKAMDKANEAVVGVWIAGAMGVDLF